jgi:predicted TIM-barrel enzyme
VTPEDAAGLLDHADALIVGRWLKRDGRWDQGPDPERASALVEAVRRARSV